METIRHRVLKLWSSFIPVVVQPWEFIWARVLTLFFFRKVGFFHESHNSLFGPRCLRKNSLTFLGWGCFFSPGTAPKFNGWNVKMMVKPTGISFFHGLIFRWTMLNLHLDLLVRFLEKVKNKMPTMVVKKWWFAMVESVKKITNYTNKTSGAGVYIENPHTDLPLHHPLAVQPLFAG